MKTFTLNFASLTKPLEHYWELCVGSCHATTALREDYRGQLEKCRKELGFRYVRFHGLFDDDMSVLSGPGSFMMYQDDESPFVLSFTNTDSIFDFLLSIGMKPFVELGFMPRVLTSGKTFIFHYQGITSPPDDYGKWQWFVKQFVTHCVERYGLDEVRQWFFEVWNEPNLGGAGAPMGFWGGTMEDYFKLYEAAARGVKAVDHFLKVGGPATSDNAWIPEFIAFCETGKVPMDFITTHQYPTDQVNGYRHGGVRLFELGGKQFDREEIAEAVKKMIELRATLWKNVPRGILTEFCKEVRKEAGEYPVYYTEWNTAGEISSDGPFGSSLIIKSCMDNHGLVQGYSYWTFTDIFEEGGMPHTPFHGGFGLLNLQGIPKASYRAFQLLHKLGGELYHDRLADGTVDVYAVRKRESGCVQLVVVNHQSLLHDICEEEVTIKVSGLPRFTKATVERIDETHGNALRRWRELGEPDYLSEVQIYELNAASFTKAEPVSAMVENDAAQIRLSMPEQGVALVTVYY